MFFIRHGCILEKSAMEDNIYEALYRYTRALSVALGFRDQMTQLHSERVRALSVELGKRCRLDEQEIESLKVGSSFHDIGKIGIADRILLKPAPFDDDEWKIMKRHPEIGERIMLSTGFEGAELAARVIRHHHEHYDGGGYPDGLSFEQIPVCARIISIADSYDAMAVTRSYHSARSHQQIMDILERETGRKHDPDLMGIFRGFIENSEFRAA